MSQRTVRLVVLAAIGLTAAAMMMSGLYFELTLSTAAWVAFALFVLLLLTWYVAALLVAVRASRQAACDLRILIAELDARGEPWRWDELAASRLPGPDEKKACDLILEVVSKVPAHIYTKSSFLTWSNRPAHAPLSLQDFEGADAQLADLEPILAEARKIIDLPVGRFHFPWPKDAMWQQLDGLTQARNFSQLLRLAAYWHAFSNDLTTALDDCLAMLRASLALHGDLKIELLVRLAMQHLALDCLQHVLAQGSPPAGQVDRLAQALEACRAPATIVNVCRGERAYTHRMNEAILSGQFGVLKIIASMKRTAVPWAILTYPFVVLKLKPAYANEMDCVANLLMAAQLPDPQPFQRWRLLLDVKDEGLFPVLVPDSPRKFFDLFWRVQARLRCAVAALAVERFHCAYDLWPQSLDELCPGFLDAVPLDPFTGKPLQFARTLDGVIIFSTRPDGTLPVLPPNSGQIDTNYAFQLWDLPHRAQPPSFVTLPQSGVAANWPGWH